MEQEVDILILRYLNNEMKVEEKFAFENRMSTCDDVKNAVEEYKTIQNGIKTYAKQNLKKQIIAAELITFKSKSIGNYKPSINGGGFSFGKIIFNTILVSGIVSAGLIYFNKMPIKHEYIDKINKEMHNFKITERSIKTDTIWHIIKTDKILNSDTVIIRNQKELDEWEKKHKQ